MAIILTVGNLEISKRKLLCLIVKIKKTHEINLIVICRRKKCDKMKIIDLIGKAQ